jgi:hypothetical protein
VTKPPTPTISEREARNALSELVRLVERVPRDERAAWYRAMSRLSRTTPPTSRAAGCWLKLAHITWSIHDAAGGAYPLKTGEDSMINVTILGGAGGQQAIDTGCATTPVGNAPVSQPTPVPPSITTSGPDNWSIGVAAKV